MNLEKIPLSKLVLGLCSQDSNTIRTATQLDPTKSRENKNIFTLERINKKTEQTRMLFGPKQRVHSGLTTVTDPK